MCVLRWIVFTATMALMACNNNYKLATVSPDTSSSQLGGQSASPSSPTSTSTPGSSCSSSAFGDLCNGGAPATPPPTAHAFFYSISPILDPNGALADVGQYAGQRTSGSMNLLGAGSAIPNLQLYTANVNVPMQDWSAGFPNYPSLKEWFGICYDASWVAPTSGTYTFVTAVDDSIAIYIDDQLVGENDDGTLSSTIIAAHNNVQGYNANPVAFPTVNLSAGTHSVRIEYYQGWPYVLGLQVWVIPPGRSFTSGSVPANSDLMQLGAPLNNNYTCPH